MIKTKGLFFSLFTFLFSFSLLTHSTAFAGRGKIILEKAEAVYEQVKSGNEHDIKVLTSYLESRLAENNGEESLHSFDNLKAKTSDLMKRDQQLFLKLISPDSSIKPLIANLFPLTSSLRKFAGDENSHPSFPGILNESASYLQSAKSWKDILTLQAEFFSPTIHLNHQLTVYKTLLLYMAKALGVKNIQDLKLNIVYPCPTQGKCPEEAIDCQLFNHENSTLYFPNSGYIFGGNVDGGYNGSPANREEGKQKIYGLDCSSYCCHCLERPRISTADFIKIWQDLHEKKTTSEKERFEAIELPASSSQGVVNLLQPGDLVVWPGHVVFFVKAKDSEKNIFEAIEANRHDLGLFEGIMKKDEELFRAGKTTYVLRPL